MPTFAQETGSPSGAADASDAKTQSENQLQEVIVTANRRRQNNQDVPIAINAVTAQQFASAHITSSEDLGMLVPGLNMDAGISIVSPFIRGVGTSAASLGTENSVLTYVDGVLIADPDASLLTLNDIQEVEVDKGPQGTLFGRNATGGVINVTTKSPSQAFQDDSTVTYGNYNTITADEYVTGGLSDNLAGSLSAYYSDQGTGWGKNLYTGSDVWKANNRSIRGKLLFTPGERDKITLIGDYGVLNSSDTEVILPGTYTNWGPGSTTAAQRPDMAALVASGAVTPDFLVGEPTTHPPGSIFNIDSIVNPSARWWQWGESLTWEHEFDALTLKYIGASRDYRQNNTWSPASLPSPQQVAGWGNGNSELTQELQALSAPANPIQWVAGVFFLHQSLSYLSPFFIEGTSISATSGGAPFARTNFTGDQSILSYAPYGQVTAPLPLISNTNLTLGVRYTHDVKTLTGGIFFNLAAPGASPYLGFATPPGPTFTVPGSIAGQGTFVRTTYRVALDHHFSDDVLGYVSYNTGFKSGGFGMIPPTVPAYKPEYLDAWETGLKTELLDHRLRWNTSVFLYRWTDMQVTIFENASAVTANAAQAKMYGLDSDLQARVSEHLTVSAGIEELKAYFSSYANAASDIPLSAAEGGGTLATVVIATGNSLPFAPDVTLNVGGQYLIPLPSGALALSTTYYYNSGFRTTPDNLLGQSRYNLLNAQAKWIAPDGRTSVAIWGNNITNAVYGPEVRAGGNPGGYVVADLQAPRTYGVTLEYQY